MKNLAKLVGIIALVAVVGFSMMGCRRDRGAAGGGGRVVVAPDPVFGSYPADYGLAFVSMLGISNVPTIRTLFGSDANFATSFRGTPLKVTLESSSGTRERFTAQLLATLQTPEGDRNLARMQITFEPDSMTEMSYIRHITLANLLTGERSEQRSRGDQASDESIMGFFIGVMELFWDISLL